MLLLLIVAFFINSSLGFNVSDVEQISEKIVNLLDYPRERNDSDTLVRMMATYAGGMCNSRLSIEKAGVPQGVWKTCQDIYALGKPGFIDHTYDIKKIKLIFEWNEEDEAFFENIRIDARKEWEAFEEAFQRAKNRYSSMENY